MSPLFTHGVVCGTGERMQVHVLKDEVQYYSRRGIEHGSYSSYTVLDTFIRKQLRQSGLILDGEVVVWNKAR
jgi:ATP-dependent DNA ligase